MSIEGCKEDEECLEDMQGKIIASVRDGNHRTDDIAHDLGIHKDVLYLYLFQMHDILYGEDDYWVIMEEEE